MPTFCGPHGKCRAWGPHAHLATTMSPTPKQLSDIVEAAKESVRTHQPDRRNPRKHILLRYDGETQKQAIERAWRAECRLYDAVAVAFPDLYASTDP